MINSQIRTVGLHLNAKGTEKENKEATSLVEPLKDSYNVIIDMTAPFPTITKSSEKESNNEKEWLKFPIYSEGDWFEELPCITTQTLPGTGGGGGWFGLDSIREFVITHLISEKRKLIARFRQKAPEYKEGKTKIKEKLFSLVEELRKQNCLVLLDSDHKEFLKNMIEDEINYRVDRSRKIISDSDFEDPNSEFPNRIRNILTERMKEKYEDLFLE